MEITSFTTRMAREALFVVGICAIFGTMGATQALGERPSQEFFLLVFLCAAAVMWLVSFGFRTVVTLDKERGILSWSYRCFGQQYAARQAPLSSVLATGLRYWRNKYVNFEPVVGLAEGKILPIGALHRVWSVTGSGDGQTFRNAKREADQAARLLGVQSLANDPDSTMQIIGGQAVVTGNSRQNEKLLTALLALFTFGMMACVLLFGSGR